MILDEDDLIPLSALQHYFYCPRQCALIHVEQAWAENRFTAEGRVILKHVVEAAEAARVRLTRLVSATEAAIDVLRS